MDRLLPTRRPIGSPQGFQRWHGLLFSHWEVPEAALRKLVPPALSLDAFDGRYFVGVVAFRMQRVRPFRSLPSFPTARDFGEINVRTYVHLDGEEPGVYFFSLDAASSVAVWAARTFWSLPYYRADIETRYGESNTNAEYSARRHASAITFSARADIGRKLPESREDSLEFFLCERYQFYTSNSRGLIRARVHHAPYSLYEADATVDRSLVQAAGFSTGPQTPHYFSPGVDVDVFRMEAVAP
jgi:uncharacterized protein YqjF (DUF2071 family)